MVRKSVSLTQEAIDIIEDYRRKCKDRIPSFSEAIETLIFTHKHTQPIKKKA